MSRERDDTGRYTATVTLDAVLAVFETVEGPVVTSADVAAALDCSRETARRKLRLLRESARIRSRKTAGRVVWWRVDDREGDGPSDVEPADVDPSDPFWTLEPGSSGESGVSEAVDEVLYGERSA